MIRFLVVDDDQEVRTIVRRMLENLDQSYTVTEASNGAKALNELEKGRFEFLITDLKMDVVNGIDLIKNINSITNAAPVIIVCSGHREMVGNEISDLIDGYLDKPPNQQQLNELISQLIVSKKVTAVATSSSLLSRFLSPFKKSS